MASDVNGPARIVVVDDEPSITDAVSTALGYEGFDVAQVHGGRDALERLRAVQRAQILAAIADWLPEDQQRFADLMSRFALSFMAWA